MKRIHFIFFVVSVSRGDWRTGKRHMDTISTSEVRCQVVVLLGSGHHDFNQYGRPPEGSLHADPNWRILSVNPVVREWRNYSCDSDNRSRKSVFAPRP